MSSRLQLNYAIVYG